MNNQTLRYNFSRNYRKTACLLLKIPTSGHEKTIITITNNKRKRLLLLNSLALPALLKKSGIAVIKQGQKPGNLNAAAQQQNARQT